MSDIKVVRVFPTVKEVTSRKDGKRYGFQDAGLLDPESGLFEKFQRMFSLDRAEKPLLPGEYQIADIRPYIDQRGNLRLGFDLVPVPKAKAA